MRRGTRNIVAIALFGLVLAIGLGIFANTIARGTVALPSTSLERTERPLAPAQAQTTKRAVRPTKARKQRTSTTTTTTATTTTTEAGDDHGGRRRGRGSDDSGGGSDDSGKGKSDDD